MRARERLGDKLRCAVSTLTTPGLGEWRLVMLPASLYGLYYLLRPLRLAVKHGWRLLRAIWLGTARPSREFTRASPREWM